MGTPFDQRLIRYVSECIDLPLQLETEISNRRGAKMLKLLAGDEHFGLKVATDIQTSVAREAVVSRELGGFTQRYFDSGTYKGVSWLLLRWVTGQSVYRRVKELRDDLGADAKPELLRLFARMASKVADLHALGYLHGDLQPNHFRTVDNTIHLLDFALTHRMDERFNYPGALVHFSAPECQQQLLGSSTVRYDAQAELYSLASVVFFLYTGHLSADYGSEGMNLDFAAKRKRIALGHRSTFSSVGCEPFGALESILERCLAADKRERYPGVAEIARDLRALLPNSR